MELDNIKMWESLYRYGHKYEHFEDAIQDALKDQGLKYNEDTKKIESIEPKHEYYKCIKEYRGFTVGKVYKANEYGDLPSDPENPFMIWIANPYFKEFFRPATEEEIPQGPKQENTLKDAVEARKEIITCAEDFQKQKSSDGELTEFEEEILLSINDFELNKQDGFTALQSTQKHSYHILKAARKIVSSEIDVDSIVDKHSFGNSGDVQKYVVKGFIRNIVKDVLKAIGGECL